MNKSNRNVHPNKLKHGDASVCSRIHLPISVTILAKNSERHLARVLSALEHFDEVLVCDTGSQDGTLGIVRRYPRVRLCTLPFTGFGPTHNAASALARHDWILSIDSDEVAAPGLVEEIASAGLTRGSVYSFPRRNEYRGKWIRWCGWHPDRCVRLYNRLDTGFTEDQVHEAVAVRGLTEVPLSSPLFHYSYADANDFLDKMQSYSSLFARQYQGKRSSSLRKALAHGLYAFFKSYVLKRGFLGGGEGFEISVYNGNTAFYKYLKLAEANRAMAHLMEERGLNGKPGDVPMKKPIV